MIDPRATHTAAGTAASNMDALTTTLCNSIGALGRGFDVTADIRLLYCKGTPGSRLVQLDDGLSGDLVLSDGLVVPNVPDDVQCSSDSRATENVPVCSFHKVNLELFFRLALLFAFLRSALFVPRCISLPECLLIQFLFSLLQLVYILYSIHYY